MTARAILFDLDGTLVDSAAGILGTLREAFDQVGLPWADPRLGHDLLGPPLYRALPPIIGEEATAAVVPLYRRLYLERGLAASTPYPGVAELLTDLTESGVRLALATSKAERAARRILANQGWTPLFAAIVGDTDQAGRPTKSAVVAEAVRQLDLAEGADAVMVGDRDHDVLGARANGLSCLGAGWGYGRPGELVEAGAAAIYPSVGELHADLR